MVNHRKCETVLTLQDAAKGSKDTKEADDIANTIKGLIEDIDNKISVFTKDYETLEKASECRRKDIQEFSDEVIKHVETLSTEFERKLETERATQMNEIQGRKRNLLNMQNMLANCENLLQAAEDKCSKVQLLTLILKISKLRDESRTKLEDIKKNPSKLHTEVVIDETVKKCANIASLGELKQD
jgi:flagellar hook-basal body complex protein FliE